MGRPGTPVSGRHCRTGQRVHFTSLTEAQQAGFTASKISMAVDTKRTHAGFKWWRSDVSKQPKKQQTQREARADRFAALVQWLSGKTYEAIGQEQGVTKQRIEQKVKESIRELGLKGMWRGQKHRINEATKAYESHSRND